MTILNRALQAGALTLFSSLLGLGHPGAAGAAEVKAAEPARGPVVLELFTSEGCSSCPSADAVLAQLDGAGAVDGQPLVAMELHVDYWDYLGWRDPFSSAEYTARQVRYTNWLGTRNYTPQLVVDGQIDVLGSNRSGAAAAVTMAAKRPSQAAVQLKRQGDGLAVQVAAPSKPQGAAVLLAITESGLSTKVTRGENSGQTLHHAPVVRTMKVLGTLRGDSYAAQVPLRLEAGWKPEALRAVVLVQSESDGHILGAAVLPLNKK
mgnify:CR=1 FL=1